MTGGEGGEGGELAALAAAVCAAVALARASLGLGYALWIAAVALGFLARQDIEGVVNHLSSGSHTRESLLSAALVTAASILGWPLRRAQVEERWQTWVRARLSAEQGRTALAKYFQEAGGIFLPPAGGGRYGAGEAEPSPAGRRAGAWLAPAAELASAVSPTFLIACFLMGIPLASGWLLFAALFSVVAIVAGWQRAGERETPYGPPDGTEPAPSAQTWLWVLLAAGAVWGGPWALLAALLAATAILLCIEKTRPWTAIREGFSIDLILLAAGAFAFVAMADGTGISERLGRALRDRFAGPLPAATAVFAAGLAGSAATGRPLAGVVLAALVARAMGGLPVPPDRVVAAGGGSVLGAALGLVPAHQRLWERPSLPRGAVAALAVAAASLLPAFLAPLSG